MGWKSHNLWKKTMCSMVKWHQSSRKKCLIYNELKENKVKHKHKHKINKESKIGWYFSDVGHYSLTLSTL